MLKKLLMLFFVCGLLLCFGKTAMAATSYSLEVSGGLVDVIDNLGQRIAVLESRVATLEAQNANCAVVNPAVQDLQMQPASEPVVDQLAAPAAGSVLINEFVADPVTGEKEWVEIYNNSGVPVDLTDWTIEEGSGLKTKLSGVLDIGAFAALDRSSLNNDGDVILLKDAAGLVIDSVTYGSWPDGNISDNAPVAVKGQSVIRVDGGFAVTMTITKAAANSLTAPVVVAAVVDPSATLGMTDSSAVVEQPATVEQQVVVEADPLKTVNVVGSDVVIIPTVQLDYSDKLVVNEILPDPEGDDTDTEWIEIFNTGDVPVNLYKWQIDDMDGGSKPYTVDESLIIQSLGYVVFSRKQTAIVLNNDKDSARLIDPAGKIVSSINYSSPVVGQSYAKSSAGWQWTAKMTPGAANELPAQVVVASSESEPAQSEDPLPVILSPAVGGTKNPLIKTAYAKEISKTASPLLQITSADVTALNVGKLVSFSGEIVDKSGRKIYLDDGDGEAAVYFSASNNFNLASIAVGDKLKVNGIVKQYKNEVRIAPRDANDVIILQKAEVDIVKAFAVNQPSSNRAWLFIVAGLMAAGTALVYVKSNIKSQKSK
jgi:hypothetical protein